jgi:hypothetical protein
VAVASTTRDQSITTKILDIGVLVADGFVLGLHTRETTRDVAVVDGDNSVLGDVLGLAGAGVVVRDVGVSVVGIKEALAC